MNSSRLRILVFLPLLGALSAIPAAAASGGDVLPFNPAIETIVGNLTGPTATAFIVVMAIGGLFMLGMSRDSPWMKTLGSVIVIGACVAKLPTLLSTLGLTGASTQPMEAWPFLWLTATTALWNAVLLALVILSLHRESEQCSPSTVTT